MRTIPIMVIVYTKRPCDYMARVIPDQLPKRASRGEVRVFELRQHLSDDCIVYYEPVIGKRYPDFLLISPTQNGYR